MRQDWRASAVTRPEHARSPRQQQQQTTNNKQQTTNNKQQTANNKQQTNKQTTNNKQQTTNNKQQTTHNTQHTTHNKQHNKQQTTNNKNNNNNRSDLQTCHSETFSFSFEHQQKLPGTSLIFYRFPKPCPRSKTHRRIPSDQPRWLSTQTPWRGSGRITGPMKRRSENGRQKLGLLGIDGRLLGVGL